MNEGFDANQLPLEEQARFSKELAENARLNDLLARLDRAAPGVSDKLTRYWSKKSEAKQNFERLASMSNDDFGRLQGFIKSLHAKRLYTDRELCDLVVVASRQAPGQVFDGCQNFDLQIRKAVTDNVGKNGHFDAKVGAAVGKNLFKASAAGALIASSVALAKNPQELAEKLVQFPALAGEAHKVIENVSSSLPMGGAMFFSGAATVAATTWAFCASARFLRERGQMLAKARAASEQAKVGPAFFADAKAQWPLPKGQSILGLSEEEAAKERLRLQGEAGRAWKSLPQKTREELAAMDADFFMTWADSPGKAERDKVLASWRSRQSVDGYAKSAGFSRSASERAKGAAIAMDDAAGALGLGVLQSQRVHGWRQERAADAKARLRLDRSKGSVI